MKKMMGSRMIEMCFWKKEYPIWAYGLECHICEMTFLTAEGHYNAVKGTSKEAKHKDKIPILK